jgi:hypothetical protein
MTVSLRLLRLTWALVLVMPLPAGALALWVARWLREPRDPGRPWVVNQLGVEARYAVGIAAAIVVAWGVPWLWHRRATRRLCRRAHLEVDPGRDTTYRTAPYRVWRWASDEAARAMALDRYAVRLCATLAVLAAVELHVYLRLLPVRSFHCFNPGADAWVAWEDDHLLLIGLVALAVALLAPRRSAAEGPVHAWLARARR